jgi:hypothetical protein
MGDLGRTILLVRELEGQEKIGKRKCGRRRRATGIRSRKTKINITRTRNRKRKGRCVSMRRRGSRNIKKRRNRR